MYTMRARFSRCHGPLQELITGSFFDVEEAAEVRIAPPEEVITFLRAHPDMLIDLLRRVYVKVGGFLDKMTNLMTGSAFRRVLYELVVECRQFGRSNDEGGCIIMLNEQDIASRAGLSRETVSRELKKVVRDGMVRVTRSGIVINDFEMLRAKLDATP